VGITIMHLEHGRVVMEWIGTDTLGLFMQLGVVENPVAELNEITAVTDLVLRRAFLPDSASQLTSPYSAITEAVPKSCQRSGPSTDCQTTPR
jgi:hypothetical protein